jgi:hypothetical protein
MQLTRKIAITAGALTLGATGVAAAVTTPDQAAEGLGTASDKAGFEVPVGADADVSGDEVTEIEAEEVEVDAEGEGIGPVDNHGAAVSAVAQSDFESGREHGEAVSEIARTNGGGEVTAEAAEGDDEDEGDAEAEDDGDGAPAEQAELGAANADEHRP